LAVCYDKKGDGEKPEKMGNDEREERKKSGFEVKDFLFLLAKKFSKKRQKGDKKDEEDGLDIKTWSREKRDEKENEKIFFGGFYEIGDGEVKKPGEGAVEPGESFEGDEKSLESVEI
jgi:hypothetical protein